MLAFFFQDSLKRHLFGSWYSGRISGWKSRKVVHINTEKYSYDWWASSYLLFLLYQEELWRISCRQQLEYLMT